MQTQLLQIVPDTESYWNKGLRVASEHPVMIAGLVIGGIVVSPLIAVELAAASAIGTGLTVVGAGIDWWMGSDKIEPVTETKAIAFRDPEGNSPVLRRIYAVHPHKSRAPLIISAESFHNHIVGEQIAHLIKYIRSTVRVRSYKIEVYSAKGAKLNASVSKAGEKLGIEAHAGQIRHHSSSAEYDVPELVQADENLYWMSAFPEVEAALKGARSGTITRKVSVDTTFGLTGSLASQAGIDLGWLGRQRYEITASFD